MTANANARHRLLLLAVCAALTVPALAQLVTSPSTFTQGSEAFIQVSHSSLVPTDSVLVTFTGTRGAESLEPQVVRDGYLVAWVPQMALNNPDTYTVYLDVTRAGATTRYGPAQITVIPNTTGGGGSLYLVLPEVVSVLATSTSGAVVEYYATTSDGTAVTCSPASGTTFPVGTTRVDCSANNGVSSATGNFPVVVQDVSGSVPFSLNLPEGVTGEATNSAGAAVTYSATSSNGTPVICMPASGSTFAIGQTTVNCAANGVTGSFSVFVQDTGRPTLNVPADITTSNPTVTYTATAADTVDVAPVVECAPASGSTFAAGTTVVQCTATDQHANSTLGTFQVTVNTEYTFSQSAYQVNTAAAESVTYTSVLSATATERLTIRNSAGAVVRTLVNATRNAGTYTDTWNGRDDNGSLLPDGPYSFVVTITEGMNVKIFDFSDQMRGTAETQFPYPSCSGNSMPLDTCANNGSRKFDLFANDPLKIHYTVSEPSRVTIVFTDLDETPGTCTGAEVCVMNGEYRATGSYVETWPGVYASSGLYAPARGKLTVVRRTNTFPKNIVVLYGSGLPVTVKNLTITPAAFNPEYGSVNIECDLISFGNATAAVTLQMMRQDTASVLRTVTLPTQNSGHVAYVWDGKADGGTYWVAPGEYSLIVTATANGGSAAVRSRFVVIY